MTTRRDFLKQALTGTAMLSLGGLGLSAKSYAKVAGANERIRVGAVGVHSRGSALAKNFAKIPGCEVTNICDVDSRSLAKCAAAVEKIQNNKVKREKDVRKMLEDKDMDVVIIATPDHWHAPAALMAMKAGKDVYLEKPCSYAPHQGEILIQAAAKYRRLIQMGNQRRSWPNVIAGIEEIRKGTIGRVCFGKAWYTNNRKPIGIGKEVPVPEWLDWDLWQGPAKRSAFKDNYVHYNWHWFWRWGTGEALNNGTHMVDILRWGMEEEYPSMVNSAGGRYFYKDDWECPDTQVINLEFADGKAITWEGRSCNGRTVEGASVGAMFYGEKGSLLITGANAYTVYDLKNNVVKEVKSNIAIDPRNLLNPSESLDAFHIQNLFDAIRKGTPLNADIVSGHKSTLMVQLGNIAQRVQRTLRIDPLNGHILGDKQANKLWTAEYEKGWEMTL
ncbi:Gfo/Idh/MocA family protein [Gallalistipes aquisgranensis]|uniref:Gfo/Idh/MocA family protein n=1 Tax=Gallalistipes aquisgranensis TaxID=2779358 RepID=UPI001CF80DE1|nr:Gfo/Idh/MocA family oxidoreductase [Gallalistipes aquisgranensis]MBE5032376.1 Gfo/Idh/MocA family oxidoreductase [Gallalistipes aquisgranensis]